MTLCDPMDYTVNGIIQARILEWVAFLFSRGSSQPRDRTQVSRIAGGFFTSWATGKPKNTGVGSLSLLQRIFTTQESNQGLLHCRWDSLPTELLPIFKLGYLFIVEFYEFLMGFQGGATGKESTCQYRRCKKHKFDPWVGKIPWGGHGKPLLCSCLENLMDRELGRLQSSGSDRVRHDWGNLASVLYMFRILGPQINDLQMFSSFY